MIERTPLTSIFIISTCALAYEILLMRLFSIIQWHHYAYMIISLALLGYGVSGTLIAIFQNTCEKHFKLLYKTNLFLFSITSLSCYLIAQQIPFNAESLVWEMQQVWNLVMIFLLLSIPFIMASNAICMALMHHPQKINFIYGSDLIGAGCGCSLSIILLYFMQPLAALTIVSLFSFSSLIASFFEFDYVKRCSSNSSSNNTLLSISILITIAVGLVSYYGFNAKLNVSPYKELQQTLQIKGNKIIYEKSSPLGLLTVVKSTKVPLRHAPGLSLYNSQEPLRQLGLFIDSGNMSAITQFDGKLNTLSYLDKTTSALPYRLNSINKVLIVGLGGGSDILLALYHKIKKITVVELNHQVIKLLENNFANFSGYLLARSNISVFNEEIRGFLTTNKTKFNLITLSLMDSFNASGSGLYAIHESYLYTTQAFKLFLDNLESDGYLVISRWVKSPPRDGLKMVATAVNTLKKATFEKVDKHMILIRSWQTSTLLIKKSPITTREINSMKLFCEKLGFDLAYYPGIKIQEANRYNKFNKPYFYEATKALLSPNESHFFKKYKYYIKPATDDKPFFHHFFKWKLFADLYRSKNQGGLVLMGMGYLILIVALMVSIVTSLTLILLPLVLKHFQHKDKIQLSITESYLSVKIKIFSYFSLIGLAFLFIEIAMMQKFILFLHHPIYSIPVILTAFLIFAGIGSSISKRLQNTYSPSQIIKIIVLGIIIFCTMDVLLLNWIFLLFITLPLIFKIALTLIIIAPLAVFMGMPLPLAMANLSSSRGYFIPWAWGINGCSSVISVILATILAIHIGFNAVIILGAFLYACCLFVFPFTSKS